MLFNAHEFELSFTSATLRKGLKLFERDKVFLIQRLPNNAYHFLIEGQFDLDMRKRGDKIMSYSCSCGEPEFCSHLSAVLFYLQKDALGLTVKEKSQKKLKPKTNQIQQELQPAEYTELADLLSNYPNRADISGEYSGKVIFQFCLIQINDILAQYLQFDRLSQNQINELHHKIKRFGEKFGSGSSLATNNPMSFYLQLAVISRLPLIFDLRLLGDETEILDTVQQSILSLDLFFENGLSKDQRLAWLEATLISGTLKGHVGIESFTFLIPRTLFFTRQKVIFEKLKNQLNKRRKKFVHHQFDTMLVARLQLAIKEAELFNTPFPFKNYQGTFEFVIAGAELKFCSGKTDKGFVILDNFYETVKTELANFLAAYQDYIILKAKEKNQTQLEIKYLKESLITSAYITPKNFDRFIELLPVRDRAREIGQLIDSVRAFSKYQSFDKLSVLLLADNRLDEWLTEAKKQKNKFNLLHKIALQKLPEFDDRFLTVYTNHLYDALTNSANDRYHEQVFLKAKKYFDQLPEQKAGEQVLSVLNRLGAFSGLAMFIKRIYPGLEVQKKKLNAD